MCHAVRALCVQSGAGGNDTEEKTDVGDETIEDDETAGVKQSYDQDTAPSSPTREVSEQDTTPSSPTREVNEQGTTLSSLILGVSDAMTLVSCRTSHRKTW